MITIHAGDFEDAQVIALLSEHLLDLVSKSPPGHSFALDLSGLQTPDISFWTAWEGRTLAGCGALKALGDGSCEIKSMRTQASHLRKGVGTAMLEHILGEARSRGYNRISLETGTGEAFEPALALYRKYGFANGAAFADYEASDFNQFLHLDL